MIKKIRIHKHNYFWAFSIVPLCLIFPMISAGVAIIVSAISEKKNTFKFSIICIASLLAYYNSVKIPESDLQIYYRLFNEYSLIDYQTLITEVIKKEHLYYIIMKLHSSLNLSFEIFIYATTLFGYTVYAYSLDKLNITNLKYFNFIIIIMMLSPILFNNSAHLHRQFLAASIFMLSLVTREKFFRWFLYVIGFSLNISIVVPIFFIAIIRSRNFNILFVITILTVALAVVLLFQKFNIFGEIHLFNNIYSRIEYGSHANYLKLNISSKILLFILMIANYISYKNLKSKVNNELLQFFKYNILFIFFILLFSFNSMYDEVTLRLSFFVFFSAPIALFFIIKKLATHTRILIAFIAIILSFLLPTLSIWEYNLSNCSLIAGVLC